MAQAVRTWRALGTTVAVSTTHRERLEEAAGLLAAELDEIDRCCSRFRRDSEISRLERAGGRWVSVSPLLFEALAVALRVAEETSGAVDPTVGEAVSALGYDRDFGDVAKDGPALTAPPNPATGWWSIELDPRRGAVRVPAGVLVDLGASAKAFAADRAASCIARSTGAGVLVSLGGDVAVAGSPPRLGWPVGIAADAAAALTDVQQVVTLWHGAVATSSTSSRSWRRGTRRLHHIVDPFTGDAAGDRWQLVSVAAPDCVAANAASTAAVVWGDEAPERLRATGLAARLLDRDGSVTLIGSWPAAATETVEAETPTERAHLRSAAWPR